MRHKTITEPAADMLKDGDLWINPNTGAEKLWTNAGWIEAGDDNPPETEPDVTTDAQVDEIKEEIDAEEVNQANNPID